MTTSEQLELVEDALHCRKSASNESCFIDNQAAAKLRGLDETVLPVIESVVHTSILPAMEQHYRIHGAFDPNSMFREGPPFLGLNEVLGAYWLLATPNPGRAIEFIRSTPWAVEGEAICALVTQYNPHRSVERPDIPTAYCDYLHSLRDNPNPEISRMAKFAIKRLALDKIPS